MVAMSLSLPVAMSLSLLVAMSLSLLVAVVAMSLFLLVAMSLSVLVAVVAMSLSLLVATLVAMSLSLPVAMSLSLLVLYSGGLCALGGGPYRSVPEPFPSRARARRNRAPPCQMVAGMLMPLERLRSILELLFREGGPGWAKRDGCPRRAHPQLPGVANVEVRRAHGLAPLPRLVRQTAAWRHLYWYLTDAGVAHLRRYLRLPPDVVPRSLQRVRAPPAPQRSGRVPRRASGCAAARTRGAWKAPQGEGRPGRPPGPARTQPDAAVGLSRAWAPCHAVPCRARPPLPGPALLAWFGLVHPGLAWFILVWPGGSSWSILVPPGSLLVCPGSSWFILVPPGSSWPGLHRVFNTRSYP
ncbi:hypothetical protein DUI87_00180 [Hirundo rustica rustica]|uniref:Plectin/eS10 N-terminal domain-containing protein n=1 Tax=Hirundo rustica rustica TaxID=333673 RepID=A0A3M0LBE1_HIRRU|nr:hypothetical protein DUI87_00180 [Hirundo rustica rustica]